MVKEELCENVVEIKMVSDRVMAVVTVFEEDVLKLTCGYAPLCRRRLEEKQYFYDKLKGERDMHSAGDLAMCLGDIDRHMSRQLIDFVGPMEGMV